jgi:hypothetical protein
MERVVRDIFTISGASRSPFQPGGLGLGSPRGFGEVRAHSLTEILLSNLTGRWTLAMAILCAIVHLNTPS